MIIKNLYFHAIDVKDRHGNTVLSLPAGSGGAVVPEPEEGVLWLVDPIICYEKYRGRGDLVTYAKLLCAQLLLERWLEENPEQDPTSKTLFDFLGKLP